MGGTKKAFCRPDPAAAAGGRATAKADADENPPRAPVAEHAADRAHPALLMHFARPALPLVVTAFFRHR